MSWNFMENKPDCYKCKYRGRVPGNAHSCCEYPVNNTDMIMGLMEVLAGKTNAGKLNIKANPHGIKMGWFLWPVNFDPVWLENCDGFGAKLEQGKIYFMKGGD